MKARWEGLDAVERGRRREGQEINPKQCGKRRIQDEECGRGEAGHVCGRGMVERADQRSDSRNIASLRPF